MVAFKNNGRPSDVELQEAFEVCRQLRSLAKEMILIFPEREYLIGQIVYALLTREHVMVHGTFGTGKSDLVATLFKCFEGSELFAIELTKFMTESSIFGLPDPKKMREEGEIEYKREGNILDAQFAELDEFLDANAPLLRSLLGVLNERMFKRGRQQERAKMHTAIASTNGNPKEEARMEHGLEAVLDRFIFASQVGYLTDEGNRRAMYAKFLGGEVPTVRIAYTDLLAASDIVVGSCQINDPEFIVVYDKALEAYKAAVKAHQTVSDRRACKLLQICEAEALMNGRYEVALEDILAIKWGLCEGGNSAQLDAFESAVVPVVKEAIAARAQNPDELQKTLLEQYRGQLPVLGGKETEPELCQIKRDLHQLETVVEEVKPSLLSTRDQQKAILTGIKDLQQKVEDQLLKVK